LRPLAAILLLALATPARAQDVWHERPKVQVALGLGASIDGNSPNPHPDRPLPGFYFAVGIGDGLLGLELRSFANGATQQQLSRLSLELVGVVRPLARVAREGYGYRVLRSLGADLGPGAERAAVSEDSAWRVGLVVGAHGDVPLGPADTGKELRLRLGVRRLVAGSGAVSSTITVKDSTLEMYGQIAFVF
jgi:hypothetical protein